MTPPAPDRHEMTPSAPDRSAPDGRPEPDSAPSTAPGSLSLPADLGPAASRRVRERDAVLAGDGWTRRFIGGPPRLREMVELYRSLGHEVHTESLEDGDLEDRCAGCALALSVFRVIYTRPAR